MKTDDMPEEAVLAVVIVRQSLIKLSGERWIRVKGEDGGVALSERKSTKSLQLRMQQLTNGVRIEMFCNV